MTTEEGQLVTWAKQSDYESHSYCRPLFFTPYITSLPPISLSHIWLSLTIS